MSTVTVIVPARNAADTIGVQVAALAGQNTTRSFDLIVADNGSTDGTVRAAHDAAGSRAVMVVDAAERVGAAYARNRGAAAATGDILVFCDADDEVPDDWLERMAEGVELHRFVGGGLDRRRFSLSPADLMEPVTDRLHCTVGGQPFAVTANLGVDRQLFEQIGGFDADFVDGSEDVDFAIRCSAVGVEPRYVESAIVHYREPLTCRQVFARHRAYGRSEPQLLCKHPLVLPKRSVRSALRFWSKLLVMGASSIVNRRQRDTVVRMGGRGVGRLEGSVRHRTLFL